MATLSTSTYNSFYSNFWSQTMAYYNNAIYFFVRNSKSIIKCTAAEKCYFLADLSSIISDVGYMRIDNYGYITISDYGNNAIFKLAMSADISAVTVTAAGAALV